MTLVFSRNKFSLVTKIFIAFIISLKLSLIPNEVFKDRENYSMGLLYSDERYLELFDINWLSVMFQEPFFKFGNYVLVDFFHLEYDAILSFYAFINCFFVILFVLKTQDKILYSLFALLLIMITPYFFSATLGALRQGLGFNFILISLMRKDGIKSNYFTFSLFVASLFHVIFFVFLFLVLSYRFVSKFIKSKRTLYFVLFVNVLIIGFGWKFVTPLLADKQQYDDFGQSNSGVTFLLWCVIFIPFLFNYFYFKSKKIIVNEGVYEFSLLMFFSFLVFYWLAPGPYRILYSCMPILICSLFSNKSIYSNFALAFCVMYSFVLLSIGAGSGSMNIEYIDFIRLVFFL